MKKLNIYAFADEASGQIDDQIAAMQRNNLQGLEIRGVDGQNISDITVDKAREVRRKSPRLTTIIPIWRICGNGSTVCRSRCSLI